MQVLRFGDSLTIAALGGETTIDYALRLKRELGEKSKGAIWVAGYSNDVMTYIPSKRVLLEGGYEGGSAMIYVRSTVHPSPWAPQIEETLVGKIHELFDAGKPSLEDTIRDKVAESRDTESKISKPENRSPPSPFFESIPLPRRLLPPPP